jgi:hypothetical protein
MEYIQNIEPFMQPHPKRNLGGDCFACALTAGLRFLNPDKVVDFNKVWEYFLFEHSEGKKTLNNTWSGMQSAIIEASRDQFRVQGRTYIIRPEFNLNINSNNWWRFFPTPEYSMILEGLLRSGWVVFTNINFAGDGPINHEGKLNHNDHFVIVDGVKTAWEKNPSIEWARTLKYYVHVVCSAKGAYWINLDDWLIKHGAAGWILMREEW